jgi:hypothetical protein
MGRHPLARDSRATLVANHTWQDRGHMRLCATHRCPPLQSRICRPTCVQFVTLCSMLIVLQPTVTCRRQQRAGGASVLLLDPPACAPVYEHVCLLCFVAIRCSPHPSPCPNQPFTPSITLQHCHAAQKLQSESLLPVSPCVPPLCCLPLSRQRVRSRDRFRARVTIACCDLLQREYPRITPLPIFPSAPPNLCAFCKRICWGNSPSSTEE